MLRYPAALPCHTSHASNTGFFLRYIPTTNAAAKCQFFHAWSSFAVSQQQNTFLA